MDCQMIFAELIQANIAYLWQLRVGVEPRSRTPPGDMALSRVRTQVVPRQLWPEGTIGADTSTGSLRTRNLRRHEHGDNPRQWAR